jgi:hypothetical protein
MSYYLLDLERTFVSGVPYFWNGNKHGYTYNIEQAGIFSKDFAEKVVRQDLDKRTIMIDVEVVQKILDLVTSKT